MDDLASHETDAEDVGIAVFLAEAETLAQVRADHVAVEDGGFTSAFEQRW
jgi:hypothetical protein